MKPRINIYEQISLFYSYVFEHQDKVHQSHVSLYMFLINQNNRANWSEWFKLPYDLAMAGACIGSKSTYYKCLNDLQEWKLIKYKKGLNDYKAPQISIVQLSRSVPLTVPLSEPLTVPLTVPLSEQLSVLLTGNIDILITDNYKLITDNIKKWIKKELEEIGSLDYSQKEQAFDLFWDLYQNKKGKDSAYKKFMKLSENEIRAILDHVPKYVQSTPDIAYRKHPTTYLNGKHWNDEITIPNPQNKSQKPQTQLEYEKQHVNAHVYKSLRGFEQSRSISTGTLKVARHYLSQTTTVIDVHEFARLLDQIENAGGIPDTVDFGTPLWLGLRESEQNDHSGHLRLPFNDSGEFND